MASSRKFALYLLVSLFSCFDHFIGVFDYSVGQSMPSCYHRGHGQRRRAFSDTKLFFARSIGTLIWHGKHGHTRKTSAERRMTAIVDDGELVRRRVSRIPQNTRINTSWAVRVNRV